MLLESHKLRDDKEGNNYGIKFILWNDHKVFISIHFFRRVCLSVCVCFVRDGFIWIVAHYLGL